MIIDKIVNIILRRIAKLIIKNMVKINKSIKMLKKKSQDSISKSS